MNIPVGTPRIQGRRIASVNITKDLTGFMERNNIGYFCVTTKGRKGIEEGLIIIENGLAIGAYYEYLSLGVSFHAQEGLKRTLNAFFAPKGVYDSYELTVQQIELLKIFNEDMLFLEPLNTTKLQGMVPTSYSYTLEEEVLEKKKKGREDILKDRGLTKVEIDNYQQIRDQVHGQIREPKESRQVEEQVNSYLSGKPPREEEPKEEPVVEEERIPKQIVIEAPPPPPSTELKDMDTKADQLLKNLESIEKSEEDD